MNIHFQRSVLALVAGLFFIPATFLGQSNMLTNGSFEADVRNQNEPYANSILLTTTPSPWIGFNVGGWERWFSESTNPFLQQAYYLQGTYNNAAPWESGSFPDSMIQMMAYEGSSFIGMNARSNVFNREGIQTKLNDCGFNSGEYDFEYYWAKAYQTVQPSRLYVSLHTNSSGNRRIYNQYGLPSGSSGQWQRHAGSFELKLNRSTDMGNRWFSITGHNLGTSNYGGYTYIDDVRLYRPCDIDSACWPGTGQICPLVINSPSPNNPLQVQNIGNAKSMRVKLYTPGTGAAIWDTTYFNPNGLPDITISARRLALEFASRQYDAEITLENSCGAFRTYSTVDILHGLYTPLDSAWTDSTANWTRAPIPCCLSTLTLQDMVIVGDVDFQVLNTITVQGGVSAAPGSDILLLAPDVVLMDSVLFDGSVSDVTITEAPCVNRMANPNQVSVGSHPPKPDKPQAIDGELDEVSQPEASQIIASPPGFPFEVVVGPNPFDERLMVGIDVFLAGRGFITLYNAQMIAVRRVVEDEWLSDGAHTYFVPTDGLASGLYFVRVEVGQNEVSRKVIKR